jgi:two-component system, LytTR family, sensor histidine kinase AlgZ
VSIRASLRKPVAMPAAVESRVETATPTPRRVIPDGCNAGAVIRVALAVNLTLAAASLARAGTAGPVAAVFVEGAGVAEPVTLLTLMGWCIARRTLDVPARTQRLVAGAVPVLLTLLWLIMLTGPAAARAAWQVVAIWLGAAGLLGLLIQHYFELRERAFSPAIAEARLQALQSRIRPHFFFNSLNAVLAVIRADPLRAERMLENIAELFRAVMADVRKLVPLEQELDLCRRYVEIEQTRLGSERLFVDWQIGAFHPRSRVPQLLLQPIIENAVRYGSEKLAGRCEIEVRVRSRGFNLEVFVSNPIAREPIQREGNQIGLANIRGRLSLVYDLEASLETRVRHDRFELTLTLPIENKGV